MEKNKKNKLSIVSLVKKYLPATVALVPLTIIPAPAYAGLITIAVSSTGALNFGSLDAGGTGGTVVISPAGARTQTGSVVLLSGAGLESAGLLSISGSTGVLIDVAMTNPAFAITGPGAPMNVGGFNIDGGGSSVSLTLPTNPATFPLGATLTVAAGQTAGVYFGTYTVMANYQ